MRKNQTIAKDMTNNRCFSSYANKHSEELLNVLINPSTVPDSYRRAMKDLGSELANDVLQRNLSSSSDSSYTLAVTAEDADFLAEGFKQQLARQHKEVYLTCFWNNHKPIPGGSIAPVVHQFKQTGFEKSSTLVVMKSIISGSCVVKTNLLSLYNQMKPERVFIVAPVMHSKAEEKLRKEFPRAFSSKFEFVWFAKDSVRNQDGTVVPGVGGNVYERLGLEGMPAMHNLMPDSVKHLLLEA